ncbi:MAG: FAD-binding oxidoreductase [Phycisphaerales bacterium]
MNDVHSRLNATRVAGIAQPTSTEELQNLVRTATQRKVPIAICGGRHAMGGQQFLSDRLLIDCSALTGIRSMDHERGLVTVQAGTLWPDLMEGYLRAQSRAFPDRLPRWGIRQKQTGADTLSIGGALAANAHGRGLGMKPIIADVESFTLVAPNGDLVECSREQNMRLFSLAIGGYGLFGPMAEVTLRLSPRVPVRRQVCLTDIEPALGAVQPRIEAGSLYGDFQFDVDPNSPGFLTRGVFSCYQPCEAPVPQVVENSIRREEWLHLLTLAHQDKSRAFNEYAKHYLATDGVIDWSDRHQFGVYTDGYHDAIDRSTGAACRGSEMITELFVPPNELLGFLRAAAAMLTARAANVIYGTIRMIERDAESFLPWARERFACVVFNLHVEHSANGIEHAAGAFRALIDLALERSGSFFLTYHRFATREQLLHAYPQLPQFVSLKQQHDPTGTFSSDWFRWLAQTIG